MMSHGAERDITRLSCRRQVNLEEPASDASPYAVALDVDAPPGTGGGGGGGGGSVLLATLRLPVHLRYPRPGGRDAGMLADVLDEPPDAAAVAARDRDDAATRGYALVRER